ncbi:MAG TPA: type III-A CRISPR-associated RAMP protein Csm4 [Bacteroidales bacterium]|nr:type III-A CRISPR-associated RAMP protein Csm4 [Bacteroidales bacterium]
MASYKKKLVKLSFTGALHIGAGKNDNYDHSEEIIHSDTIKSALYATYRQVYPELSQKDDGEPFFASFRVSSAFPYFGNELFFPKPLAGFIPTFSDIPAENKSEIAKKSKKIQYVGFDLFNNWVNGIQPNVQQNHLDSSGKFLFSQPHEKNVKVLTRNVQQRVYIPPQGSDAMNTQPYFIERLFFGKEAGLYFLLDYPDSEMLSRIQVCLHVLGDIGFGTDKSVGNGQFEATIVDFDILTPDQPTHQLALGLYCPAKETLSQSILSDAAFSTKKRGGFIVSAQEEQFRHFRKKSVYMFTEGSLFPAIMTIKGKLVDLKPETVERLHPVWRDGNCLFIPVKTETI